LFKEKQTNMPYKSEKIVLPSKMMDKRVKLLPCQKEMISYWTERGLSQRQLAKMFNVSRRLITFIQDPSKRERNLERRKESGGSKQYYDKEKHNQYMKDHRKSKHERMKPILSLITTT
jgi:transposase